MTQSPVWPIPQEMTLRNDGLRLSEAVVTLPGRATKAEVALAQLFTDMIMDDYNVVVPVVKGKAPKGRQAIRIGIAGPDAPPDLPGAEGYVLKVTADGITAIGRDQRGAQYAIATLLQLSRKLGPDVVIQGAEIRDWPYKPVRGVHLYLPGSDHLSYARRYLRDFLIRYKYNRVFLEIGGGVRFRELPEVPVAWRRFAEELSAIGDTVPIHGEHVPLGPGGRFQASVHTHLADGRWIEPDELAQLCDWARELGIAVTPEVQSLSHCYFLALSYPELAELPEADFPDSYCPSNPRSYELLFRAMQVVLALTKCTDVHIGHDEWRTGALCPRCREHDSGKLYGEDVVKIAAWLRERGQGVWMWADHLVPKHNAVGRSSKHGMVWYDHPDTQQAAEIIRQGAPEITLLNWSHWLGKQDGDDVLANLGFKQIYGNFHGPGFVDWPGRSAAPSVLGAEVSSWCAWEDYELGMIHYPDGVYCANMLWSNHWPEETEAKRLSALQMPKLRDRMRRGWEKPRLWSEAVEPRRKRTISIAAVGNAPQEGELASIQSGEYAGVPYQLDGAVVVSRRHQGTDEYPHDSTPIPIGGKYASLIFWQTATQKGGAPMHAGDGTHYPREAAELLGWYEILYADGLTRTAEVRYGENVLAWNEGFGRLYYAREIPAGRLASGEPLVVQGLEWTNPRPAVEIVSVTLKGAKGLPEIRPKGEVSEARPMLLGITGIEHPKWEDFRPGKEGKLPGVE